MQAELPDLTKLDAKPIEPEEVARYYLECELSNILSAGDRNVLRHDLSDKDLWRLLEALSFTHRANSVFHTLTDIAYDWYAVNMPIGFIKMTGMTTAINHVMRKPEIGHNPVEFAKYMREYFAEHPSDDPEGLNECRPRPVPQGQDIILLRERGNGKGVGMLDGSHRMLSLVSSGKTTLRAYYAKLNGKKHKPMIGDAAFLLLRKMYESTSNHSDRQAIIQVARLLVKRSINGKDSVRTYWMGGYGTPETEKAGMEILDKKQSTKPLEKIPQNR